MRLNTLVAGGAPRLIRGVLAVVFVFSMWNAATAKADTAMSSGGSTGAPSPQSDQTSMVTPI